MVGLVDRMRDLATHNRDDDTRTSKRDKASLRTAFRSILASVEGSGAKADKVGGSHQRWIFLSLTDRMGLCHRGLDREAYLPVPNCTVPQR